MVTQKETKEKIKTRREKLGGYFLTLSQLTFAAVVLNGIPSLFEHADSNALLKIILGVISTAFLAWIGNNILK